MKKLIITALAASLLSGCATPVTPSKAVQVQPAIAFQKGDADIIVTRDTAYSGGGATLNLKIDNRPAAALKDGESVKIKVDEGAHTLTGQLSALGITTSPVMSYTAIAKKGIPAYVRYNPDEPDYSKSLTRGSRDPNAPPEAIAPAGDTKEGLIQAMEYNQIIISQWRDGARHLKSKKMEETLTNLSIDAERKLTPLFKKLKAESTGTEKELLVDAYSQFLAITDPTISINSEQAAKASFTAAIRKYELY